MMPSLKNESHNEKKLFHANKNKIAIFGSELAPRFNEATAKKMKTLSDNLGYDVCTVNYNMGRRPYYSKGQYHVFNGWLSYKDVPLISFLYRSLVGFFFIFNSRKYDLIILSGGLYSPLLRVLDPKKCIVYVTSAPSNNEKESNAISKVIGRVKGFIVETSKGAKYLESQGIPTEKILNIFPIIDEYKNISSPPPHPPFKLLFASSPRKTITRREVYIERGIPLLLEAASILHKKYDITLTMLWRTDFYDRVIKDINIKGLTEYISVIDEEVDIYPYIESHHAVIIPYQTLNGALDYPLSALESIKEGRPAVSTLISPIAGLIKASGCGTVSGSNTAQGLAEAIELCIKNYDDIIYSCKNNDFDKESESNFVNIDRFLNEIL